MVGANADIEQRHKEIDTEKSDSLEKQKEGKGHWKQELASSSESVVGKTFLLSAGEGWTVWGCEQYFWGWTVGGIASIEAVGDNHRCDLVLGILGYPLNVIELTSVFHGIGKSGSRRNGGIAGQH